MRVEPIVPSDFGLAGKTETEADGLLLRVKGDGQRYKINLKRAGDPPEFSYQASFDTRRQASVASIVRQPISECVEGEVSYALQYLHSRLHIGRCVNGRVFVVAIINTMLWILSETKLTVLLALLLLLTRSIRRRAGK